MPLAVGSRLGAYEIVAPLGSGGMGEVYRARDTKLNRDVAIKIVPEALAADPTALARFQNEAQAVAALSHPNILGIFDVGADRGIPFAVMELLEGETLRERLNQGGLPSRKAIEYATQIAAGLAAAHARGITHRDLKPENVFVTRDGRVKILDFGLAKATAPAATGGASFEATLNVTLPGTVLGTVGYMAPEQVRGQAVDHRSDFFAFGAILYEMLAGQRAFSGPSSVETMNAILKEDPPELTRTNATLSPALDRIVRRCLEKNPDERFQSARDLGFALEALSGSSTSSASSAAMDPVLHERQWLRPAMGAAVVTILVAAAFFAGRATSAPAATQQIAFETKTFDAETIFNARFAPDGQTIVFSAALEGNVPELFVSRPGAVAPQSLKLPRTHLLSVSSKGELAVLSDATYVSQRLFRGTLARMPIDGAPRPWMEAVREADWSPDGSTLAVIHVVGREDLLEYPVGKVLHRSSGYLSDLRVSPDGSRVAFFEHPGQFDNRGWVKLVDRGGAVRTLTGEYWGLEGLAWAPDGSTILYSGAEAGAEGYQPRAVSVAGVPTPHLLMPSVGSVFVLDVARDGRWLVTRNDDQLSIRALVPGADAERELPWLGSALSPHLSGDGKLLLFVDESQSAGANYAVSLRKTDGSSVVRLGEGNVSDLSPDATQALAYVNSPPQTVVYPIGPGEPLRLKPGSLERIVPRRWFPDGKRVIVCGNEPSKPYRCYEQDLVGGLPKPITPDGLDVGPVSPDGLRIVAIASDRTNQILSLGDGSARPAPGVTADDQVLAWSRDGQSLFVQRQPAVPARLERVDLSTGRRTLFRELAPPDRAGLMAIIDVDIVNDGQMYAYGYWKRVSRLFVVSGAVAR
jgi:serine/threonine protein kinase/Tol biopolymer transport system component